ncbi:hypothetical protein AVEN_88404-1 [Araneus ventricosus]|uniref:Bromo domain-containing protein n=1 Tax=Araneus ventricosus TaxID=182803 RepID=A0A4Y2CXS5_ARAVE|nr:hypothetical protein AVEN_19276-1 [Araneus ventricosus]GBM09272.1 hypothetical protein AVEN_88404-1 [Araneus ventricosus]
MRNIPFHFASGTHATAPVDAKVLHLPDYNQVIKHPLHLGTIRKKLYNHEYKTQKNLLATKLQGFFEMKYAKMPDESPGGDVNANPEKIEDSAQN